MNYPFLWFVKVTGMPFEHFYFKKKVYFEDGDKKLKKIKGPAMIVSNHTSVYDYLLIAYTFMKRTIRTLAAEILYNKNWFLSKFLKRMGMIKVDRNNYDFAFMSRLIEVLKKGQVGLVFPESRIPTEKDPPGELLEFKPSYVYIALEAGVPIVPVAVNGVYGKLKKKKHDRARIIIGKPIDPMELLDRNKSEKENIQFINDYVKSKVKDLKIQLDEKTKK